MIAIVAVPLVLVVIAAAAIVVAAAVIAVALAAVFITVVVLPVLFDALLLGGSKGMGLDDLLVFTAKVIVSWD